MVSAWKVCAPNRSLKQHVADNGKARRLVEKYHMARRVPRAVTHIEGQAASFHRITIL